MIAHWKTQEGTLVVGNAAPGALGYKTVKTIDNKERYKLLMGAVNKYRIRLNDGRIPSFAELFATVGATKSIGNIYGYFPSFEVDTKSKTSTRVNLTQQQNALKVLGTMKQRLLRN